MTMQENIDYLWITVCAIFVFGMQAGFMCLETGLSRKKNNINVALKNLADFGIATALFWLYGFALMFGPSSHGWFGSVTFFFESEDPKWLVFFVFQAMFVATAASIISGAVAERTRFYAYLIITALTAGLIYPLIGHWAWAGSLEGAPAGWLHRLGFHDFAGSTVVHSTGGWIALAAVLVIGPRMGRFTAQTPRRMHGSNVPIAVLGVMILWGGWFGFNGGSARTLDAHTPVILVNTFLAGGGGFIGGAVSAWLRHRRLDRDGLIVGPLAGLVAITASCSVVSMGEAALIGLVSGALAYGARICLERARIDDVVSAIPVHLVGGIWGTLSVAFFGDPERIASGLSAFGQLGVQLLGVLACGVLAFGGGYVGLRIINRYYPLRVSATDEDIGLNIAEHDASTDHWELVKLMREQTETANISLRAPQDPFTDAGQIGLHYNNLLSVLEQADAELKKWRNRVSQELSLAVEIQRSFLPAFTQARFPVYAVNRPARELSGDFYDVLSLDGRQLYFIIADVSGKGVHAAVVMAQSIALFRAYVKSDIRLADLVLSLNRELYRTSTHGMFVTLVVGIVDLGSKAVTFVNAGHEPVIYMAKDGGTRTYPAYLPPLGVLEDVVVTENRVSLETGKLYICTDGITEAQSNSGATLGSEGLRQFLRRAEPLPKEKRLDEILNRVGSAYPQSDDDRTLMVIEFSEPADQVESNLVELDSLNLATK